MFAFSFVICLAQLELEPITKIMSLAQSEKKIFGLKYLTYIIDHLLSILIVNLSKQKKLEIRMKISSQCIKTL